ncbi:MAG TPA: permease-like cell division protein FtsX [Fimbriimonadaceae bacterium]|nr:permease-like cell division protein FtsX [Fimbriimonadaceae bacterium]
MSDWLEFVIGEAFLALRRNLLFTFAAITTVAMALFLIGGFAYTYYQADRYIHALPTQLEVRVFLKDGMPQDVVTQLGGSIQNLAGEASSVFISKETAWDKMRADHPDYPNDLENPLPDAYTVTFKSVEAATAGAATLANDPAVDKVVYLKELAAELKRGLSVLRYVGYCGLVLLFVGGIIIFNAIELTVVARRREVRIMQLVGASIATIRIPFVLEGTIHGVLGGAVAAGFLAGANAVVGESVRGLGRTIPAYPWLPVSLIMVAAGALIGFLCSTIATRAMVRF